MLFWGIVVRSPHQYTAWQWPGTFLRNMGDHLPCNSITARKVNNTNLHSGTSNLNFSLCTGKENVRLLETQQPHMSIKISANASLKQHCHSGVNANSRSLKRQHLCKQCRRSGWKVTQVPRRQLNTTHPYSVGQDIFLLSKTSSQSLETIRLPTQWVLQFFSGDKAAGAWCWPLTSN